MNIPRKENTNSRFVQCFDSSSEDYHKAFQVFLDHTDQKARAREHLEELVMELSSRKLFVDAGAGNGKVTAWLTDAFDKTIAAEPNESLRKELIKSCPHAEVLSDMILDAKITQKADFILASHVFYYIPGEEWKANLERLVSWLAPKGMLTIILQNHESDCMRMLRHFLKKSFDLKPLAVAFYKSNPKYNVHIHTIPSYITTRDANVAFTVAEFMLNLLPLNNPPLADEVKAYVEHYFKTSSGEYRFSCTQDFLEIRNK